VQALPLPPFIRKARSRFLPSFLQRGFAKASTGFYPQSITDACDYILTFMAAFDVHALMYSIVPMDFVTVAIALLASD